MPPPPAAMMYSQPGKGSCLVPDNRHELKAQDLAYKKARQAAASAPRLLPALVPAAKAVEVPKVPSCLRIGSKRPRPREEHATPQAQAASSPNPDAGRPVASAAPPAAPAPAPAPALASLVAYGDSDSEENEPGDT